MSSRLSENYTVQEIITQGKLSDYLIEQKTGESIEDLKKQWESLKKKRSDNNAE
jgi:prefoldin subunit 5